METSSGVFTGTPYGQKNYYGRFGTDQADSVIYGSRTVSNCHSESTRIVNGEKTTDFQNIGDSHDPESWIKKNILGLLEDGEGGVAPELAYHSTGFSKGHSLRNGETSMMKMAGLSPSLATEVYQENQKMERLFSLTQEATCITSPELEEPYFQPLKNGFTKFWNQWQVSNTNPEFVVRDPVVKERTERPGDSAEPDLVHLMESLSEGEQSGTASFQNLWPPGKATFLDPVVPSQDFAYPYPLTLDLSDPVASINPYEEAGSRSHLVSLGADASSSQPPSGPRIKSLIAHWKLLEEYGKSQEKESGEWYAAWQDALKFASCCAETDYHFNLNVAIALTRLKCIDQAKSLLLDQLTKFNDEKYISCASNQLGFVFYLERDYVNAIKYYMRGFSATMDIPNETYSHIYISMKHIIKECADQYFINDAISWFNNLTPKTRRNKVEITSAMPPLPYSYPSFSKSPETAIKHSGAGQCLVTIARWKELEAAAKAQTPGEPQWCEAWTSAKDFALGCAKVDYHFNLNAAIALTRLNDLDQAVDILFQQLRMLEREYDQAYFMGVNKQLGYIFYRKESYVDVVYHYMFGIDRSRAVPDKIYNYITTAMGALGEGVCPEFRQSARNWYHQLFSRSMEAKRLAENKLLCAVTAPVLF